MSAESLFNSQTLKSSHHRRKDDLWGLNEKRRDHNRRNSISMKDPALSYTYVPARDGPESSHIAIPKARISRRHGDFQEEPYLSQPKIIREKPTASDKNIRVVYVTATKDKADKKPFGRPRKIDEFSLRSSTQHARWHSAAEADAIPSKRASHIKHVQTETRPPITKSSTTASDVPSRPHSSTTASTQRRNSFFVGFFGPTNQSRKQSGKIVECLTCLDEVPRSKSAKLPCGHRMCNSCLKRIFRLSVSDPHHMPPKCCTSDHIPLRHVENLFSDDFKRNWNKKFQEFSTRNRIYCPARNCGEWIKPSNIYMENGKKYRKCSRCKTKVCLRCNGKRHKSNECPKDEETSRLLETAKDRGWQRCYNCRTMVELKEGCNHMTCRCRAEFCMICGLKWKTCNCPWFNFDAVGADRLPHMEVIGEPEVTDPLPPNMVEVIEDEDDEDPPPHHLRKPNTYREEIDNGRAQKGANEEIARSFQKYTVDQDDDSYDARVGGIYDIGNGAGHLMNQYHVREPQDILTRDYSPANAGANYVRDVGEARRPALVTVGSQRIASRYAPHSPLEAARASSPIPRNYAPREHVYNAAQRLSDRAVSRGYRTDHKSEAEIHTPLQRRASSKAPPSLAALAGLQGRQKGDSRVRMWRKYVGPGAPEDDVLSIEMELRL